MVDRGAVISPDALRERIAEVIYEAQPSAFYAWRAVDEHGRGPGQLRWTALSDWDKSRFRAMADAILPLLAEAKREGMEAAAQIDCSPSSAPSSSKEATP